jgi:hypothetical protein
LADKYEVPVSAIALNWVIGKGAIPLGGARNAKQAEQVSRAGCRGGVQGLRLIWTNNRLIEGKGSDVYIVA